MGTWGAHAHRHQSGQYAHSAHQASWNVLCASRSARTGHKPEQNVCAACSGIVEHVVLMGVPVSTRAERWAMARSAVAGRLVNAYSRRDWVLGLIYRGSNGFVKGAGGLCPVAVAGARPALCAHAPAACGVCSS